MESNFRIFRPLNHQICMNLFSRDYIYACTKLSELHTKAPEHSFAYTKKTIEPAFGRKLPEIFEDKPVASGSIAQVHRSRATLRFRRELLIINMVAKLSNFIPALKCWRLDESVQQFAVFIMSQVAHLSKGSCPFASTCASCYFGGNL
ncbi:PREDICTED: probable serine/threonine- [Prunus dulcis]|uniref:PREDICTED: probable serine/threonine n=1 Tax=Prunus dulcis TaxID=3755 RepID=A0A5E4FYJ8_PRUDU|nr:PREDICTED: probable serine/threonine- [Prunus dulcis]